jgi:hypothetical protein
MYLHLLKLVLLIALKIIPRQYMSELIISFLVGGRLVSGMLIVGRLTAGLNLAGLVCTAAAAQHWPRHLL